MAMPILNKFPIRQIETPMGQMAFCQSGLLSKSVTHVLLHGIGSGASSWLMQMEAARHNLQINMVAWYAPGYGTIETSSDALPMDAPKAADYARTLWAWLDALNAKEDLTCLPITLVGHSLGCLMAASAATQKPERVKRLILLSPAQGYARALQAERDKKLKDRLDSLAQLGPEGISRLRSAAMLSPTASVEQIAFVQQVMGQIKPHGYTQAAKMLSEGDILSDLLRVTCPIEVASGSADTITPYAGCAALAAQVKARYTLLAGAGHLCALESAQEVSNLLGIMEVATP
jgi:pimeloyl-ACP methyl ester carboxylesterase